MSHETMTIGLDIGSVSLKLAVWAGPETAYRLSGRADRPYFLADAGGSAWMAGLVLSGILRHGGEPLARASEAVHDLLEYLGIEARILTTGSGGREAAAVLGGTHVNEVRAIAEGVSLALPDVRTVLEMGGASSKFIGLERDPGGLVRVADYEINGECAAGTGLFFDQQVERLEIRVEDVGTLVRGAPRAASIAGRCSVFAKSDMIHAQQRGYTSPEILKGLCESVVRNFKGSILKGRNVVPKTALIGGLSSNAGIVDAFRSLFGLWDGELLVPEHGAWLGAMGAAAIGLREGEGRISLIHAGFTPGPATRNPEPNTPVQGPATRNPRLETVVRRPATRNPQFVASIPRTRPLSMEKVTLLRDRVRPVVLPEGRKIPAFLGIDIGSVSTNLALIDENGGLIHGIYTMTRGRPIEVVGGCLREMEPFADRVDLRGAGTTGSGRDLIGLLVGADVVKDEITAHKTGAVHVAADFLGRDVDTIFEIGGQDSKFISLKKGVVTDFCLNEACAAGTGSFLEEQARQIGVAIRGEFAELALGSAGPLRLGERCTVFMAKELVPYLQKGLPKEDLVAGLALSVAQNYLGRVVKKRPIGKTVFLQGGTAYNDAVAAAFATLLDREIIVPPHNGIMGAIGAALLARDHAGTAGTSAFRGWRIENVPRSLREFTCAGCTNRCMVQEFTVAGEKSWWGDKCSDRYRKRARTEKKPSIPSLVRFRESLLDPFRAPAPETVPGRGTAGIPLTLFFQDRLPFWTAYLKSLGFGIVLSGPTNPEITESGVEACVNEPCFPMQAAHGHLVRLAAMNPDFLFFPNVVNEEDPLGSVESFLCPWVQTFPLVAKHVRALEAVRDRIVCPRVSFRDGREAVERALFGQASLFRIHPDDGRSVRPAGGLAAINETLRRAVRKNRIGSPVTREAHRLAVRKAYEAQNVFRAEIERRGRAVLELLKEQDAPAVVLAGRPYNLHDSGMNLNLPAKLEDLYGANVIPMDFLPLDRIDIKPVNDHMFWNYGRRILQAARFVRDFPRFELITLSNFKCGPDSYIRHYVEEAAGKPFLFLQLDSHSNDAGVMTRVEAFLESKGML